MQKTKSLSTTAVKSRGEAGREGRASLKMTGDLERLATGTQVVSVSTRMTS